MKETIYAIKKGRKTGIVYTWEECKESIYNFSNAEFKSFNNLYDAYYYLEGKTSFEKAHPINRPCTNNTVNLFVDGSFKDSIVGYGVYLQSFNEDLRFCGCCNDCIGIESQNTWGEIVATLAGLQIAINHNFNIINIIYDFEGIENWINKTWKAKSKLALKYFDTFNKIVLEYIKINFIKVKSHSGIIGNNYADKLAFMAIDKQYQCDFNEILNGNINEKQIHFVYET